MGSDNSLPLRAVLFDRDGTLVQDVPYNGDPDLVEPMGHAEVLLRELRGMGLATGVISNQSGVSRGLLTLSQVSSVNDRIEELLGPFDVWEICPHAPEEGCSCRKPAPGMIIAACRRLGVSPAEVAYIGDIGTDMEAAEAAGARGVLVPTPATRAEEVEAAAGNVAADLNAAIRMLLDGPP
jgi:HAD superfamily hydrolase (TIGR01662 family)